VLVNDADVLLLPFFPTVNACARTARALIAETKISEKMVKTYLRYVHEEAFGIVSSSKAPTITDASGKFAFAPAIHEVFLFFRLLSFSQTQVTSLG
jgi:hypothetical protein